MIPPETIKEQIDKRASNGIRLLEAAIDKGLFTHFDGVCSAKFIIPASIEYIEIRDHHLEELSRRYRMNGWHKFILTRCEDAEFKVVADSTKPSDDPRDNGSYYKD